MKNARIFFTFFFIVFGLGLSLSVISFAASQARPGELFKGKITIGTALWPGYLALYVAKDKGYFKEAGLDVEVKNFIGLTEVSQEYVAGRLQGRANLVFDALKEQIGGFDHKVVLAIDYSNGSDAILTRTDIQSIQDFRQKRIGYEFGTLEEFFLAWALAENAMELSDIIPVNANPEIAAKMLKDGQVDVAVSYEPFVSKYVASGDFHVVYSSADAPGVITDILTFRTDFIQAHPETIQAIVEAYFKALNFWKVNPEEVQAIVAKVLNDTPESIGQQLKGIKVLDERDNQTAFTFSTGLQSLYGNLRQIRRFIHKQNGGGALLDTDKLIERKFIKGLDDNR